MPLHRRLPKRGFISLTREDIAEVRTERARSASKATEIDLAALKEAGIVPRRALGAKVILAGKLERKVALKEIRVSKGARAMIEAAGGSIQITEKPKVEKKQEGKEGQEAEAEAEEAPKAPEGLMATALPNVGKGARYGDLKRRLLFLLGALVVFRIGAHIPVPGIDPNVLAELLPGRSRAASSACSTCSRAARCRASRSSRWASCRTSRPRSSCS